ncbi:MAG TPA: flagellar basal body P-ring protein FlgI [Tepidisphaeraceae bacterium]|nr:flagellar basal body P-ring protein FlgI [Tepidisphaeraceae bacterium]
MQALARQTSVIRPTHSMPHQLRRILRSACAAALIGLVVVGGCSSSGDKKDAPPPPRYPTLPPKENVPAFMKGTVFEMTDVGNKEPYPVSGYGLIVGLDNTGNNFGVARPVQNHMIEEMVRHGFGSQDDYLRQLKPEAVLSDPRTAIVEVYAFLPPGARAGQRMDAYVRAAENSATTSLAHGTIYQTNLYDGGVNPLRPKGRVNVYATVRGSLFVNPTYTRTDSTTQPQSRPNLREGVVMNGGVVAADRPLWLRIRTPQLSLARACEAVIDQYFSDEKVANTQDEGKVDLFVPHRFNGDWEHFIGVATHLYFDRSQGAIATKAQLLAQEAQKPNAPLMDISYCWEGLGPEVVPFIQPLYTHASPDVAFAAARAGVYVSDAGAEEAMLEMARTEGHPFQLNAVKALGGLPQSTRIERMMTQLLSAKNALVRVEAYRVLSSYGSPAIISHEVADAFILDRIPTDGLPLVYATRTGVPRIALFGKNLSLNLPIIFRSMQDKLTITSQPDGRSVVVFDRTGTKSGGIQAKLRPDLNELIYRLGGGSDDGFRFGYSDVVGILQGLSDGHHLAAPFVLQDSPSLRDAIEDAPPITEPEPATPPIGSGTNDAAGFSPFKADGKAK